MEWRYHADSLDFVENILVWDGRHFTIDRQSATIEGEDKT